MLSLRGSIFLSALCHAAIFLAFLFVSSPGRARVVYKPQYQVRLVRPQDVASLAKPAKVAKPTPPPAPKPAPKPKPAAKKVVLPDKKAPPPKEKEKKVEKKQPEKKVEKPPPEQKPPEKKVEKKPEPAPAERPKQPTPEEVLEAALARIEKRAGSKQAAAANVPEASSAWAGKQKEIEYSAYYDQVERAVRENWIPPQDMDFDEETAMTVVSITLLPDGRVLKSTIEESSGDPQFDQSVMRAILKSTPFPPPPIGGLKQQNFDLGLRFHSTPQAP